MSLHYFTVCSLLVIIHLLSYILENEASQCFFPSEYSGEYITQNIVLNRNGLPTYSHINITSEGNLHPYGQCYSRKGNNYIVMLGSEESNFFCFRCFNLQLVAKNILLVHTTDSDFNSKCSSSEATVNCPLEETTLNDEKKIANDFYSIILYRTKNRDNDPTTNEFCPFDGEIKLDYYIDNKKLCDNTESSMNFCPSGSSMIVNFKNCLFAPFSTVFECIGHWQSINKNYLAIIDRTNSTEPKYKCGTYDYDKNNSSLITLTISNDCSSLSSKTGLIPNQQSLQVFKMQRINDFFHRPDVLDFSQTIFPEWFQGRWQYLNVKKKQLIYQDHSSFKSYYMSLINQYKDDKFVVLSRTQCGEENYKCLWINKLDTNIIEFQMSSSTTNNFTSYDLCNDDHFDDTRWITQARIDEEITKTSCPISGNYSGILPDDENLCALITTDCKTSDIMYFQVGACETGDIYESRTYRCLGQWTDKTNTYTYTKRIDVVDTYECFVGLRVGTDNNIFMKEAGEMCFKNINPLPHGMEMHQLANCSSPINNEGRISVQKTEKELTTKYETVFERNYGDVDLVIISSTQKPKTPKKHKTQPGQKNILENDTSYKSSSSSSVSIVKTSSSSTTHKVIMFGLIIMIHNLQNSIIVKNSLLLLK